MLAPSGGGLILYQAYGRKDHLLEDKKILSVGAFNEVFCIWKAFRRNIRDLGSFGDYRPTPTSLKNFYSEVETVSQITRTAITTHLKTASQDLQTASDCTTQPII
ncbi:hypothetical protein Tco_0882571 [Tanacetum coccineum]